MKKFLEVTITAILIFFCSFVAANASESKVAKVTFNEVSARKGDIIEIIVNLSNCEEIKSMAVVPLYDSERLEYVHGEWLIGNAILSDWNQEEQNGVILYSTETDLNGEIAKFEFRVMDNPSWDDIDFSCKVILKKGNITIDADVDALKIYIICTHDLDTKIYTKNPTCFEKGYTYKLCKICNREEKISEIDKIPHDVSDWIIDKESTINAEGLQHKECMVCKRIIIEEIIPKLGQCNHIWSEEVLINEPTNSNSGMVYRTCQVCGETLKLFDISKRGIQPGIVAVISISTGVGTGLIVFLVIFLVLKFRKRERY